MRLKPGTAIGEFRIEKLLSDQGATAQVYLARGATGQVVLKIARSDDQRYVFQDHLRQDVEMLRRLVHPGVVHLYPVLGDDVYAARAETLPGEPWYLALEYVAGKSLAAHMRRITHTFPLAWRLELFRRLVEGVGYLHEQGYAHCDLKPEHILLRSLPAVEQAPQPVLIDFGSACSLSEPPTALTASLPYAAPELLRALDDVEAQATLQPALLDTWALGAVFYELLVGSRLIRGYTRNAIMRNALKGRFDPGKAPPAVRPMLRKTLQIQPEKRASLQDLLADLLLLRQS